jgi:hypothetical protein
MRDQIRFSSESLAGEDSRERSLGSEIGNLAHESTTQTQKSCGAQTQDQSFANKKGFRLCGWLL